MARLCASPIRTWCEAEIYCKAATEFIEAQYRDGDLDGRKTYFSSSYKFEPIFNAREGVYDFQEETLKSTGSGFTLLQASTQAQNCKIFLRYVRSISGQDSRERSPSLDLNTIRQEPWRCGSSVSQSCYIL